MSYLAVVLLSISVTIILKDMTFTQGETVLKKNKNTGNIQPRAIPENKETITRPKKSSLINDVPFTPQAPFANWSDIVYEEGCEEASMLMAIYWARGNLLTSEIANKEIRKISEFERGELGISHDTSVYDTAKIMEKYFSFHGYGIQEDIQKADIFQSLENNGIVMIPVYGRKLLNKNFTPPGPIPHMLIITGYDSAKKQFITNDPGTKYGH